MGTPLGGDCAAHTVSVDGLGCSVMRRPAMGCLEENDALLERRHLRRRCRRRFEEKRMRGVRVLPPSAPRIALPWSECENSISSIKCTETGQFTGSHTDVMATQVSDGTGPRHRSEHHGMVFCSSTTAVHR